MAVKIFFCYAHEDEALLNKLKSHLKPLQREGLIEVWHDRDISAGKEWEREINEQLNTAQIILLLVSSDFINSDYCYGIEMKRALDRHGRNEAKVIPVILRPVYWQGEPLGKLQALPTDGKPVESSGWHSTDEALYDVVEGIRKALLDMQKKEVGFVPFHEILERELRERKWKEEDFAKRIGISTQELYKWEKGELEPTSDAYYEILCELFEMTPEEMGLTRDETMGGILRSQYMVDIDKFENENDY